MNSIFDSVPLPPKEAESEYNCGDGAYMLTFASCNAEDYYSYRKAAEAAGFTLYSSNDIDGNLHCLFCRDISLYVYYIPCEQKMRIIAGKTIPQFSLKPVYAGRYPTTLWQFEVDHSLIDCGMCYIVRCDDGSFFIIDSAHFYSINDDIRILDFLRKISGEDKPRVSGWFFSHAHDDHINKFCDIINYHCNEIEIEALYYNFIDENHRDARLWGRSLHNFITQFRESVARCSNIPVIKLHTGMHFCVRNLEFDVLCTHEDIYPGSLQDFNNSSTAIMMTACGSKVFFPGDCSTLSDRVLLSRYKESLRCDVIQVSHHGHTGLSAEFYRQAGAACALFPVTVIKYDEEWPRQEANRTAVEVAEESYIASNGTAEIPLPYSVGNVKLYPDETFEDFNGVYNLWGYQYTEERKAQLYADFLARKAKK